MISQSICQLKNSAKMSDFVRKPSWSRTIIGDPVTVLSNPATRNQNNMILPIRNRESLHIIFNN